jgi:DNA repair exonuclease SbcCD ATPase subunit
MIIKTVTVENWRTLRNPATLEFCDGVNVVHGDNGRGKSTVMEALRMAFFDRFGAAAEEIRRIRPWGCELAPRVRVEFSHGGRDYRLTKQFLVQKSCLVERLDGPPPRYVRFMESDSAEKWLRSLMDAEAPAKGASRPENWGLAGLLWIPQGGAGEYAGLASAIKRKIRAGNDGKLDNGNSQVQDDGDTLDNYDSQADGSAGVESAICREYRRYFTETGKPYSGKDSLKELTDRIDQARADLGRLQRQLDAVAELRESVRAARAEIDACETERADIAAQAAAAETQYAEYDRLKAGLESARPRLDALEPRVKLLERDLADLREARAAVDRGKKATVERENELKDAQTRLRAAEEQIAEKTIEASTGESMIRLEFRAEAPVTWEPVEGSPAGNSWLDKGRSAKLSGAGRVKVRLPGVGTIAVTAPKSDNAAAVLERLETLRRERESCTRAIDKCRRDLAEYAAAIARLNEKRARITMGGRGEEKIGEELNAALGEAHVLRKNISALTSEIRDLGGDPRAAIDAMRKKDEALRAMQESKRAASAEALGRLSALGGMGLHEEIDAIEAELRKLEARHADEIARANAVKLIYDTLEAVKREFREQVATPVEARVSALFAQVNDNRRGTVKLAGDFSVAGFIPEDAEAPVGPGCLSGGEREQLYFCARLALAEQIIGAPESGSEKYALILDDFLTATDDYRLSRLKDLLREFEGRYQYLIFTCHPARYDGINGKMIPL